MEDFKASFWGGAVMKKNELHLAATHFLLSGEKSNNRTLLKTLFFRCLIYYFNLMGCLFLLEQTKGLRILDLVILLHLCIFVTISCIKTFNNFDDYT